MQIISITVHNFRGIHDARMEVHPNTLFVGKNNSGKSTCIDAIRVFYEKDGYKYNSTRDWPHVEPKDDHSWVEIEYELTQPEFDDLKAEYQRTGKLLKVRKILKSGQGEDRKAGLIYAYDSSDTLSTEPFYGAKNVQSGKLGNVIYIPAISKIEEHTKLSGPSPLRDLLQDILKPVLEAGNAYEQLLKDFSSFATDLKAETSPEGTSFGTVETELNDAFAGWDTTFELMLNPPKGTDILKNLVDFRIVDTDTKQKQLPEAYGSGFQRHFIYSLINLRSKLELAPVKKKAKDFTPDLTLLLYEEPEAFLHPTQQDVLARDLRKLAGERVVQSILSTHSANFVARGSDFLPSVVRFRRDDAVSSAYQISSADWLALVNANQAMNTIALKHPKLKKKLPQDDQQASMEAVKYMLWLNPDRAKMLFADLVICVEGPTESGFINRLLDRGDLKPKDQGIYVLDCIGKFNIHRFMKLLQAMGVNHSVLYDDDSHSNDAWQQEVNALVESTKDATFTRQITSISQDFEHLLGLPKPGNSHRKPQHALYQLENNKINTGKLAAFVAIVNGLL